MWTTTYHRFASRAAFLGVCEQAGWPQTPGQEPGLPQGVVLDVIGPLVTPASVGPGGVPMPSEMLDARYHVNLAWHAREMDRTFATSQVLPDAPSRGWDLAPFPAPGPPPVPASVVSRATIYNFSTLTSGAIFKAARPRFTLRMMSLADFVQTKGWGLALLCSM